VRTGLAEILVDDMDALGGLPSARARSLRAYWRRVLSPFSATCRKVDWRM
jgi:hypothetical protein